MRGVALSPRDVATPGAIRRDVAPFLAHPYDGLTGYVEALVDAAAAVLLFDHRHLGDSGGTPLRIEHQRQDYRAAISTVFLSL